MIKSMTAYGRGEHSEGDTTLTAELKSLNNRYRDVVLRIPKSFQALEDEIRSQIASRVRRGRIEVSLQMGRNAAESEYDLELNLPLVRSLIQIFEDLNEQFGLDDKIAP
ncbi:MAG: YicC/YloC family endoribonuclease, partial [Desulfobacteraceae bacterium]